MQQPLLCDPITALVVICLLCLLPAAMGQEMLFDFEGDFDPEGVPARDVEVGLTEAGDGHALRIDSGHGQEWPGIDLVAPAGKWDLSAYSQVKLGVKNLGDAAVSVCCRVDNPGANGVDNCVTGRVDLEPGAEGTLAVELARKSAGAQIGLFGMRGYPEGFGPSTKGIDAANVTQLVVFVPNPQQDHSFSIDDIRAEGQYTAPPQADVAPEDFYPFIDTFGQYMHAEWPGKVHSLQELRSRIAEEEADLAAHRGPEGWNEYGGWAAGPTLEATGFFRAEKYQGRWWLVDPAGKLFISHGMDCVGSLDYTPITGREKWWQDFPGEQPEFQGFIARGVHALHGHYAGTRPDAFSFSAANALRKYGEDWEAKTAELAHRRLRSWGMNTVANWSHSRVYTLAKTPYTVNVGFGSRLLEGSTGYWGKFRDVFDPGFAAAVEKAMAGQIGKSAGDPWCLGYFVDNEIAWGQDVSLAQGTLASPPDQVAKQVFLQDLKEKYESIPALNEAWGTEHASWEALLACTEPPDAQRAREDLLAFSSKTAEMYFKACREAVKKAAPNNLYLGCRFAWANPLAIEQAAKYCDVVSFNLYRKNVADFRLPEGVDAPVVIGEFHFGALDRGMFHTGLVRVDSQEARAEQYEEYVGSMLENPVFVGCHWFKYQDEPTTGRTLDEENYQIGFVDCADTPYPETIAACRRVAAELYRVRLEAEVEED